MKCDKHGRASRWRLWFYWCLVVWLWGEGSAWAGLRYLNCVELEEGLRELSRSHAQLVRMEKGAETLEGRPVWRAELGVGEEEERGRRPALLLVAGIEGNDQLGTVCALAWMRRLAGEYTTNAVMRRLLETTTIYVFPRLNVDAAERFFRVPRMECGVNSRPVDDDHDGLMDEDGPEDLDGDGLITWMRIEDEGGEYILDPAEPRLLMKADRLRGERGRWRYLVEGRDNDGDEAWNEDGLGGVNFDRNFPYNYEYFAPGSGLHPVSEVETRMLAEFVRRHGNIGIAFTFGAADNLAQTPKSEAIKSPPESIRPEDIGFYRELGKLYREALGLRKELPGGAHPGSFSDWMYYHQGRLSLAAVPWSPALQLECANTNVAAPETTPAPKAESTREEVREKPAGREPGSGAAAASSVTKSKGDKRTEEDRALLRWLAEKAVGSWVEWKAMDHPDFVGKKVEIGGWAPYARSNPPEAVLGEWVGRQVSFLCELVGKLPRIGIRKVEVKALGGAVYDLRVQVENTGYLPTALGQGEVTGEVWPTRVEFQVADEAVLGGLKRVRLGPIAGQGGMEEVRLVVRAPDRSSIEVEVVTMLGGRVRSQVVLETKE